MQKPDSDQQSILFIDSVGNALMAAERLKRGGLGNVTLQMRRPEQRAWMKHHSSIIHKSCAQHPGIVNQPTPCVAVVKCCASTVHYENCCTHTKRVFC